MKVFQYIEKNISVDLWKSIVNQIGQLVNVSIRGDEVITWK